MHTRIWHVYYTLYPSIGNGGYVTLLGLRVRHPLAVNRILSQYNFARRVCVKMTLRGGALLRRPPFWGIKRTLSGFSAEALEPERLPPFGLLFIVKTASVSGSC